MEWQNTSEFAAQLDAQDPLAKWRDEFYLPQHGGQDAVYLCGNSLGLQPKGVRAALEQELKDWAELGVEGHFDGKNPWFYYSHFFKDSFATLVGAQKEETMVMNTLTTNLQLLLTSFYRPDANRRKILIEAPAFPSDHYAIESHLALHGNDPVADLIELKPVGEGAMIPTEYILDVIEQNRDELALVMLSGVNYYTGQLFDIEAITKKAHEIGIPAGFDLAHAVGNVPLKLHDWDVDFAVWCSYKYLNSGPGGPGGAFVHERHGNNPELPRLAGWWGYDESTRFEMKPGFKPQAGAAGWAQSNDQVLSMAAHRAALDVFDEVGITALREKSLELTGYLEFLINGINTDAGESKFEIITPSDPNQRGCQLSLIASANGKEIHDTLTSSGVISDWREPNVIRIAPIPLYNSFQDVFRFATILKEAI
jgi:kynureninase